MHFAEIRLYVLTDGVFLFASRTVNNSINAYYMTEEGEDSPFICSTRNENGMLRCSDVPPYTEGGAECLLPYSQQSLVGGASVNGCVNWNQYYTVCKAGDRNPHKGAVNFDNIGYAWIAIFQVSCYRRRTKELTAAKPIKEVKKVSDYKIKQEVIR